MRIGTKEENPAEKQLPMPAELQTAVQHEKYSFGAEASQPGSCAGILQRQDVFGFTVSHTQASREATVSKQEWGDVTPMLISQLMTWSSAHKSTNGTFSSNLLQLRLSACTFAPCIL